MLPERYELLREGSSGGGCTEPVAIALAAAHAYKVAPVKVRKLNVVSPNVFKNARRWVYRNNATGVVWRLSAFP